MDETTALWLKDNVDKYRNPDGRVRIGGLESALEASLGVSVENPELYKWLEKNGMVHSVTERELKKEEGVKMGWPKGMPRKGRISKVKSNRPRTYKKLRHSSGVKKIEAYEIGGRIFVPLESRGL